MRLAVASEVRVGDRVRDGGAAAPWRRAVKELPRYPYCPGTVDLALVMDNDRGYIGYTPTRMEEDAPVWLDRPGEAGDSAGATGQQTGVETRVGLLPVLAGDREEGRADRHAAPDGADRR